MIKEIKKHFDSCYPQEGCGVIVQDGMNAKWIPCTNVSTQLDTFVLCPKEYTQILIKYKVLYIVHNHIKHTCQPSGNDIKYCDATHVPFIIFSYPSMEMAKVYPVNFQDDMTGRPYIWEIQDCLSTVLEYYARFKQISLRNRPHYIDDWWLSTDHDYFSVESLASWGFVPTDFPNIGDAIIFQVRADRPNHCGILLANDTFLHHAQNRLSTIENLYPGWAKHVIGYYKYDNSNRTIS